METSREPATLPIGLLGYSFMGRAHSLAYHKIPYAIWPFPARVALRAICGRNESRVAEVASRFGYEYWTTDWRKIVEDPTIVILDNCGPNHIHLEPTLSALEAGKHVICEKPLGRNAEEARRLRDAAVAAGTKHMTAFNYRFLPAVQLMKRLIAEGRIGRIYHVHARYLQSWLADDAPPRTWWRLQKDLAGAGALGDLGSHIIDLSRYLCGEPQVVVAAVRRFVNRRPLAEASMQHGEVDVDDAISAVLEYDNGALGTLEVSRVAVGRSNFLYIEISGSEGSVWWDLENLNNLHVCYRSERETPGFRTVSVTEKYHPYLEHWWPRGHILGWEHSFVHELAHFLRSVSEGSHVEPEGATFEDGYRAAVIVDAILEAGASGRQVKIRYE